MSGALDPERERPQQFPGPFVLLLEGWEGKEAKKLRDSASCYQSKPLTQEDESV